MRGILRQVFARSAAGAVAAVTLAAMAAPAAEAAAPHPNTSPIPLTNGAVYHGDGRTRILDTRHAIGVPTTTPVPAGGTIELDVAGRYGMPSTNLGAVMLDITVTDTRAAGSLTAFTSTVVGGVYEPTTTNLSWSAGQTVAALTTVGINLDGPIELHNLSSGSVHVVADLTGYYTNDGRETARPGPTYVPITPVRVLDTRRAIGVTTRGPVPPGGSVNFPVTDVDGVPATGVVDAVLNITATDTKGLGYLTAYQGARTRPATSNLDWTPGQTVANLAIVPVGLIGTVAIGTSSGASVDLVADLVGYYTEADTNTVFETVNPGRVVDTSAGIGTPATPVPAGGTLTVQTAGWATNGGSLPAADTRAVDLDVTVSQTRADGYLTVAPHGAGLPATSTMNWTAGRTVSNHVVTEVGPDGRIDIHNSSAGTIEVAADLYGGFLAQPGAPTGAAVSPPASGGACDTTAPGGVVTPVSSGGHTSVTLTVNIANQATWTGTMNARFTVGVGAATTTYDSTAVPSDMNPQVATVTITDPAPGGYTWSAVTRSGGRASTASPACYFRIL